MCTLEEASDSYPRVLTLLYYSYHITIVDQKTMLKICKSDGTPSMVDILPFLLLAQRSVECH